MKFTKLAIVLVFFLSIVAFLLTAFLSTIRENEKAKRVALENVRVQLEEKVKMLEDEKLDFQKQVSSLNKELELATASLNVSRSDLDKLRTDLEAKDKMIEEKSNDINELQRAIQISQDRNRELEASLEQLEKTLFEMKRSGLGEVEGSEPIIPEGKRSVTDEGDGNYEKALPGAEIKVPSEEKPKEMAEQMILTAQPPKQISHEEKKEPVQAEAQKQPEATKELIQAPSTTLQAGRVLLVNRKFNFVVMNVGSKQGLKVGDVFMVLNGADKIAKVEVEKLYDDFAAAKIVDQVGDTSLLKEGSLVTRA